MLPKRSLKQPREKDEAQQKWSSGGEDCSSFDQTLIEESGVPGLLGTHPALTSNTGTD